MDYIKLLSSKKINIYVVVAIISAVVFFSIYGIKVLNPMYINWLLVGGDLSQHYLGWTAYRASSWHFPIGMVDTLAYPHQTSIIFTDSIPIFAVFFKFLSPILPDKFQYFGIWGIFCFILQGVLAARIIASFIENKVIITMASVLFVFTPVMIWRMYAHTALAGQWILLLGLEPIFVYKKYQYNKKIYLIVGLMGILSVSIHMYFVLMSGIILLGICSIDIFVHRRFKRSGLMLTEYLAAVAIISWLLGGFSSEMQAEDGGLGMFSININTFFNPQGWSQIFRELPLYGTGQYEGFGYLGGGCIVLLLLAIICLFDDAMQAYLRKYWKEGTAIILVCVVSIMVSLSPIITIGDQVILQMQLSQWLIDKWSIFRASGRIVWIVVYIIMLGSCVLIAKTVNTRMMVATLSVALLIQIYDISDVLKTKHENIGNEQRYVSMLTETDFWNDMAQRKDIQHIVYFSMVETPMMYSITDWAIQNDKTVNNFYFARSIDDRVAESRIDAFNTLSDDMLYIFKQDECMWTLVYDLHYYQIDGLIVGYRKKIPGYQEMLNTNLLLKRNFGDNLFLSENGGIDTENGREIYPGGVSYGPYWSIPKGKYVITIEGQNLPEDLNINIYSMYGELYHDFEVLSCNSSEIRLNIFFDEKVDDLEVAIKNNTVSNVLIKSIEMRYA